MERFVVRQPIFDATREVRGYALAFGPEADDAAREVGSASPEMVGAAVMSVGVDAIIGEQVGFFPVSSDVLLDAHWSALPADRTVLDLRAISAVGAELVLACVEARRAGYRLVAGIEALRPEHAELLQHLDFFRVDVRTVSADERAAIRAAVPPGVMFIAADVDDYDAFRAAMATGHGLFTGRFFCTPESIGIGKLPAAQGNLVRLLAEINRKDLDFSAVEALLRQEPVLSLQLLRYLRSAFLGWRHEVETIAQALRILGEAGVRRWASLAALGLVAEGKPREVLTTSLVRAQFAEEIALILPVGMPTADPFLVGLLSSLDALLDRPLAAILHEMPLATDLREAVADHRGVAGELLSLVIAYETSDWEGVDRGAAALGLSGPTILAAYCRAVSWTNGVLAQL
jgi:c-di-GMP-related signal transduction protein